MCYHPFNLTTGRSPSFASTPPDYSPCSDSRSLRLRTSTYLTLPGTVTRRLIMQKARCHHASAWLQPLVGAWFQDLFHPGTPRTFHLSLTVLCAIGLLVVFSLTGWCRLIQRGFLRSPPTQDTPTPFPNCHYRTLTLCGWPSQTIRVRWKKFTKGSYYPECAVTHLVWAVPRSLATTTGITIVFSSCGYLDVSVHRVCLTPKRDNQSSTGWVAPFGYQWISPCQRVPTVFRRLPRPSSPPEALGIPQTPFCCVYARST